MCLLEAGWWLAQTHAGPFILCPSFPYPGVWGDRSACRSCAASPARRGGGKGKDSSGTFATKLPVTNIWPSVGVPEHKAFNLLTKTWLEAAIRPLYPRISHHRFGTCLYLWLQCPLQGCPSGFFHHLRLKQTSAQLGIGTRIYCQCLQ